PAGAPPLRAWPAVQALRAGLTAARVRASAPPLPRWCGRPGTTWRACGYRRSDTGTAARRARTAGPGARAGPSALPRAEAPRRPAPVARGAREAALGQARAHAARRRFELPRSPIRARRPSSFLALSETRLG